MKIDAQNFLLQLKKIIGEELYAFLLELTLLKHRVYFVGGIVRDYVLDKKVGNDIDVEIHCNNSSDWISVKELLAKKNFEELKFQVMKYTGADFSVEIGQPRIEHYPDGDSFGHGDFEVNFPIPCDLDQAWQRRDFTFNAIGLEFGRDKSLVFIDPFFGIDDLEKKLIRPVGTDFYNDPVRFLRAIRFIEKFKLDDEALDWKKFNLSKLNYFHFEKELSKLWSEETLNLMATKLKMLDQSIPHWLKAISCFKEEILAKTRSASQVHILLAFCQIDYFSQLGIKKKKYLKLIQMFEPEDLSSDANLTGVKLSNEDLLFIEFIRQKCVK